MNQTTCIRIIKSNKPSITTSYVDNGDGTITLSWTCNRKQYGASVEYVDNTTHDIGMLMISGPTKSVRLLLQYDTDYTISITVHVNGHKQYGTRLSNVSVVSQYTSKNYFTFDVPTQTITAFHKNGISGLLPTITSVVIPPTIDGVAVTIIGTSAFYNQTDLKTMTFPSTLVRIQNGGLQACAGISELVFPDGFTIAGQAALYDCSSLIKVTLPADVTFGSFNLGLENDYDGTAGVWNLVDGTWVLEE
jgi:hypothetical protein